MPSKRALLCTEFLDLEDGLVTASTLLFDWRRWPEVLAELRDRAGQLADE